MITLTPFEHNLNTYRALSLVPVKRKRAYIHTHVRSQSTPNKSASASREVHTHNEPDSTDDKVDFLRPALLDVVQG